MFKKVEALNKNTHQDLRFSKTDSFEFAKAALGAPVSASELWLAARYYPIVFPLEHASPMVLFALNQKTNLYVNNDGKWKVPYVPAHIRRYPFTLANTAEEDSGDNFVVCIDREAPHFAAGQGDPLFTADGEPSDVTRNAMSFLKRFQEELNATQTLCRELEDRKVLVERTIAVEKNGEKNTVGGFRCVDTEKLRALEDAVLAKWVRNDLIGLVYVHLQSLDNLKALA